MMLQQDKPEDYVIATGESHTVREFVSETAKYLGMPIKWEGKGINEVGKNEKGEIVIRLHERYYRPHEVDSLLGVPIKAKQKLGWIPKVTFKDLVELMVESDIKLIVGSTEHAHD